MENINKRISDGIGKLIEEHIWPIDYKTHDSIKQLTTVATFNIEINLKYSIKLPIRENIQNGKISI